MMRKLVNPCKKCGECWDYECRSDTRYNSRLAERKELIEWLEDSEQSYKGISYGFPVIIIGMDKWQELKDSVKELI